MDIHKVCVNVLTLGYAEYVPIRLNASKTLLQNHKKRQTEQWHNFEKKTKRILDQQRCNVS